MALVERTKLNPGTAEYREVAEGKCARFPAGDAMPGGEGIP